MLRLTQKEVIRRRVKAEMSGFCLAFIYVCMFAHTGVGVCGGRRRALDSLELKIETVVSCPKWLLGTELQVSGRAANAGNHWASSAAPPPPTRFLSACFTPRILKCQLIV